MQRAYCQKLGPSWVTFIETPRGTWVELRSHADSQEGAKEWITSMGYQYVTKEESYLPHTQ